MTYRIGIDSGGTFTDLCMLDEETGRILVKKVSSTPVDPAVGIISALRRAVSSVSGSMKDIVYFAHGTTVGTNALLTGQGARTGLITTEGFRDLLELARGRRPKLYDLQADKPVPLVPRDLRLGVAERVLHDGTVEIPLDLDQVSEVARYLHDEGVESIAVCLLYSYLRPEHERAIAELLAEEFPDTYVSISSDVLPEFREYERLSTTVVDAYIGPVLSRYLARLRGELSTLGISANPHVTQSNGGVVPFHSAEHLASRLVLSGPSTGVVGAALIAEAAGFQDVITFDMGGTSTDVSLVRGASPTLAMGTELDGRPVRAPMVDVNTVGAGGGSIAWVDAGGHLKVGPRSAGSDPGPACYGRGEEPTVTDANVVLQVVDPEYLLGGELAIDSKASYAAVERIATQLGFSVVDAARGILRVVVANMARLIRVISVQRGYDPRDYVLVPFGGAGPQHASMLARELGIRRLLVPEAPGALAALGLLMTDIRTDFMRTRVVNLEASVTEVFIRVFGELEALADRAFDDQGVPQHKRSLLHTVEMRYEGQNYELPVAVTGNLAEISVEDLAERFALEHVRVYGYRLDEERVQAVTFRVQAVGEAARAKLTVRAEEGPDATSALIGFRDVVLPETGERVSCPLYHRSKLAPGNQITGPAVINQMDTTTLVSRGDTLLVDAFGNLLIEVGQ